MKQRIAAVQPELAELDQAEVLERGQVRLVVPVVQAVAGGSRLLQPGQPGPDAVRGQILDLAVVLMTAARLANLGYVQVAHGAQPRG